MSPLGRALLGAMDIKSKLIFLRRPCWQGTSALIRKRFLRIEQSHRLWNRQFPMLHRNLLSTDPRDGRILLGVRWIWNCHHSVRVPIPTSYRKSNNSSLTAEKIYATVAMWMSCLWRNSSCLNRLFGEDLNSKCSSTTELGTMYLVYTFSLGRSQDGGAPFMWDKQAVFRRGFPAMNAGWMQ